MSESNASEFHGPPYFRPKETSSVTVFSKVGQRVDRPFMILATFAETSLGDLVSKIAFVSSLKDQFDHARLILRYNDFRPYSRDIVSLSPNIDHAEPITGELHRWLRPLLRDLRLWRPLSGSITRSKRYHEAFYDLVVVDSMANSRTVPAFEHITPLRIPEQRQDGLADELAAFGVDPSKCFAVIHYRDGSYELKARNPVRNGEPESYRGLTDHIIDHLGCQVVLIGHPEMAAFPARPGFVDLSRHKNSFMLQAFAVSRARYMIGGASGPITLGWSLNVPTAVVDCAETQTSWGSEKNVALTHELTTPDGSVLRNQELADSGFLDIRLLTRTMRENPDYSIRKNSADELSAAANYLHQATADTPGWRVPDEPMAFARPNSLIWPPQVEWRVNFLDI